MNAAKLVPCTARPLKTHTVLTLPPSGSRLIPTNCPPRYDIATAILQLIVMFALSIAMRALQMKQQPADLVAWDGTKPQKN